MIKKTVLIYLFISGLVISNPSLYGQEMREMKPGESDSGKPIKSLPKLAITYPPRDKWIESTRYQTRKIPVETKSWGWIYSPQYSIETIGRPVTERKHQMERTGSSQIRIAASTDLNAKAYINNKEVKVYPNGAFVGMVDLVPGENEIRIRAESNYGKTEQSIFVERRQPMETSPDNILVIDSTELILPSDDLVLKPGDELVIRCKGTPGAKASFQIGNSKLELPMRESEIATSGYLSGIGGIYTGSYLIQPNDQYKDAKIRIQLIKNILGKDEILIHELPGSLTIDTNPVPTIGRITSDYVTINTDPVGYNKLMPLMQGIKLYLIGRQGDKVKIKFSDTESGWIDTSDIEILPAGTPIPYSTVGSLSINTINRWTRISMGISDQLPYRVDQYLNPSVLELTLYGAVSRLSWITEQMDNPIIQSLQWKQIADKTMKIRVELKNQQQWGWDVKYDGNRIYFDIKNPPVIARSTDSPVKGLKFVLDPGHGGRELGAVGAAGIMEKDVNLGYVNELKNLLELSGATVKLTHGELNSSASMKIRDRMLFAISEEPDIYLVLHNNSGGGASDPIAIRGTSAYYHQPQALALGHSIYRRLSDELDIPQFGFVYFDAAAVRTHQTVTALVEGAFMSNPEEEFMLTTREFQKKLATAIFHGIEDFLAAQK